jgi:histidine triad (HIT) family protein
MTESAADCIFCKIVRGEIPAHVVFEDEATIAFLDHRPLFPGHVLLLPRTHHETLVDLPDALVAPLFANAKLLAEAVTQALGADGSFLAINNVVSQSVPHVHVHVVPRRQKDGLKGFFWPRRAYESDAEAERTRAAVRDAIAQVRSRR